MAAYRQCQAVVWWTTPVEIESAIARLLRMNQLVPADWVKARQLASALAHDWSFIQPLDAVRIKAMRLVESYDLRAADALQLAAALEWCQDAPQGRMLYSADERLLRAAVLNGFDASRV